jgi:dihydroneopterin aldolase
MSSPLNPDLWQDMISIDGLDVECIVGLYEHERTKPQNLVVNVRLAVDVEQAAKRERLEATVDYEWVSTQIAFLLKVGRFRLLETAAYTICRALLLEPVNGEQRAGIEAIDLSLRKPGALGGRGVPELRMRRRASDLQVTQESKAFGAVDIIHETADVGIYRLRVSSGARIGTHVHREMEETELLLSTGLECQGEVALRGTVRQWPRGVPHGYENPTASTQTILCVDRPPFSEADEISIAAEPAIVSAQRVWDI